MDFTIGTYVAIAAALFFYLRLIILQRQKLKQKPTKSARRIGKAAGANPSRDAFRPTLVMANRTLVIVGAVLILLGALISFLSSIDPAVRAAWWLPVTAGILLMSLGIG